MHKSATVTEDIAGCGCFAAEPAEPDARTVGDLLQARATMDALLSLGVRKGDVSAAVDPTMGAVVRFVTRVGLVSLRVPEAGQPYTVVSRGREIALKAHRRPRTTPARVAAEVTIFLRKHRLI